MASTVGYTDGPTTVDLFEIDRYKQGLIQFIKTCKTPITIAIQGDWGSGKTSLMSMIDKELEKDPNIQRIWFNTWQYSQFNKSDDLAISLLSAIGTKRLAIRINPTATARILMIVFCSSMVFQPRKEKRSFTI